MMAASFKSLYQKRPHESVQMRTAASRGAPDTALRLARTYLEEHLEQAEYTIAISLCVLILALSRQLRVRIILATRSDEMLPPAWSAYPTCLFSKRYAGYFTSSNCRFARHTQAIASNQRRATGKPNGASSSPEGRSECLLYVGFGLSAWLTRTQRLGTP